MSNEEFEARLARLEAKHGAVNAQAAEPQSPDQLQSIRPARPRSWTKVVNIAVGLALVGGVVAYAYDDISALLPEERVVARNDRIMITKHGETKALDMTGLEKSLFDSMSQEDIQKMLNDPRLKDMTIMQQMLMSH